MRYTYIQAIAQLYPSATVQMNDPDDFATVVVQNEVAIDKSVLEAWMLQKNEAEPMILLRKERTRRLAECDWVTLRAVSTGTPIPEDWAAYMQALRDLPDVSVPQLTAGGQLDMSSVNWPTPPS
jgi:hypothetical protein